MVNGRIILEDKILFDKALIVKGGIIEDIVDREMVNDIEIIDVEGKYISPGFIDLHIHGSKGTDVMDGSFKAMNNISKAISEFGVTSFLGTTMSMGINDIHQALDVIKNNKDSVTGAKLLGVHLEGPFINEKYKGAQSSEHIIKPDYNLIKDYMEDIKLITLAPEVDGSLDLIKAIKENGDTVISMGHTGASFEEAMSGIDAGVSYATHTFNGMTGLHHRKPGAIGAIFSSDIYSEIIADTIHVHKGLFQMFIDIKGKDKVILITDCVMAGCLPEGEYELGGQKIWVDAKASRLEDGTLAGSILTLNRAIKNIWDNTNYPLYDIVRMATLNPATVIGIDETHGSIVKGKAADLTIFDDECNICMTVVDGDIKYKK